MALVSLSSGRQFDADAASNLLEAAGRAGLTLPHSCRTGRCSSCKAQVKVGQTLALRDELGLTVAERAAGWILTCVRSAQSDLTLDIDDLGDVPIYPAKTLPARIQSLERLAPDVMRALLRLPPSASFQCHAGQYIDVIGPSGVRRSYSLARRVNVNQPSEPLELHIRRVPGGELSDYWFERAQVNDLLRLNGPLGTFFVRDVAGLDLVFLATGTGLAPVKAMVENLLASQAGQSPRSIRVYWGGRHELDHYWQPDWPRGDVEFIAVRSRPEPAWVGARGHVQDVLLRDSADRDWARTRVYACGSEAMIHSAQTALIRAGLLARHFHADAFVSSSVD